EPAVETAPAENSTIGYLRRLFEPGDFIDLQFIHQTECVPGTDRKKTHDVFMSLADVNGETVKMIEAYQADGWNAFVCMNALKPERDALDGKFHRRERDVAAVRSVYTDCDENAAASVEKIRDDVENGLVPEPHFILRSSPTKFYVIWLTDGMTV